MPSEARSNRVPPGSEHNSFPITTAMSPSTMVRANTSRSLLSSTKPGGAHTTPPEPLQHTRTYSEVMSLYSNYLPKSRGAVALSDEELRQYHGAEKGLYDRSGGDAGMPRMPR